MTHLDPTQFVDLLEGSAASAAVAHLDECPGCTAQLSALRSAIGAISTDDAPDPSPLFWEHFSSGVNQRIDAPRSGWTDWLRQPRLAAVVAGAAVLIALAFGARMLDLPQVTPKITTSAPAGSRSGEQVVASQPAPVEEPRDDVEADGAWAVVRTAAEDLAYEDAEAEGLAPRPGSAEIAVLQMSGDERAELARLIENELKRTGA